MLKTIGIIGGLGPQSTLEFYSYLINKFETQFGNQHFPEIAIYSVSFEKFKIWTAESKWDMIANELIIAGKKLVATGVEFIVIPTNTMHIVFDEVKQALDIPMLSIVEETGNQIIEKNLKKVGLLGTKATMEASDLYDKSLKEKGVEILIPREADRLEVSRIIYDELVRNIILDSSKEFYLNVIEKLKDRGAEGIIMGCTEIPLLIKKDDTDLFPFDTNKILADATLEYATK